MLSAAIHIDLGVVAIALAENLLGARNVSLLESIAVMFETPAYRTWVLPTISEIERSQFSRKGVRRVDRRLELFGPELILLREVVYRIQGCEWAVCHIFT